MQGPLPPLWGRAARAHMRAQISGTLPPLQCRFFSLRTKLTAHTLSRTSPGTPNRSEDCRMFLPINFLQIFFQILKASYDFIKKMPRMRTLDAMGGVRTRDVCLTSHISTFRLQVSLFPMRPFLKPEARPITNAPPATNDIAW